MTTRLKLKPGQKGTKRLVDQYGDDLVSVRYRYDEESHTRLKTVEIIVERKQWTPPPPLFATDDVVPVRIAFSETANKQLARAADGRWDPEVRLWFIQYGKIKGTPLEKHIVLDARITEEIAKSI